MNCPDLEALIQRWLDGEGPVPSGVETAAHLQGCPACREVLQAAHLLREGLGRCPLTLPPQELSLRIQSRLLSEHRRRARTGRLLASTAMAASLLLVAGILYLSLRRPATTVIAVNHAPEAPVPSLHQHVEEAGEAVVSLTERAARQTVDESRLLLPRVVPPALAENEVVLQTFEPSSRSLDEIRRGMSEGLEPVTSSARRAVDLFLGEIPSRQPGPRKGS
jgi:hypothetical protein